jgi:methionyl-tRNA formyltransferase
MELSKGRFDEGQILLREERRVVDDDRFLKLHTELAEKGSAMVMEVLADLERHLADAKPQTHYPETPSKAPKLPREYSLLDPRQLSAREVWTAVYTEQEGAREMREEDIEKRKRSAVHISHKATRTQASPPPLLGTFRTGFQPLSSARA